MFRTIFNKIDIVYANLNKTYNLISYSNNNFLNKDKDLLYILKMKKIVNRIEEKLQSSLYKFFVSDSELTNLINTLEYFDKQLTSFNNKCPMCTNNIFIKNKHKHLEN